MNGDYVKRLAITNGELDDVEVTLTPNAVEETVELKQLDAANVRSSTCPQCKYSPLDKQDGLIFCKSCGSTYKVVDDAVYELI